MNNLCISSIISLGVQLLMAIGVALDTLKLFKKMYQKVLHSKNFFWVYFAKHCHNINPKTKLLATFTVAKQSTFTQKQAPRWGGETSN